ncbi:peptidylprolyl isomerase [Angustibacter luteus]|uniref:Peptidyl-prolyl cis-trans isomerase n=1 Tax=Angustibacter luteus TaxID=658456 RepID=A0ABW1JAH8_9ACTN
MPIERDRERAKRRYAKRQKNLAERAARKRRNQQVIGAVLAVVLVAGGVVLLTQLLPDDSSSSAAGATSSPTANASGSTAPTKTPKSYPSAPAKSLAENATWNATVKTSAGDITMELYGDKAPQTVASFIFLSKDGFYDDTSCHRLTTSGIYVLQCGDPTGTGSGGPGYQYGIENAPKDGKYPAGTLAMARGDDPNTNGSQFFMVYKDTDLPTTTGGYSIFGKVTNGLDVLQTVAAAGTADGSADGAPKTPVTIESITVEKK